ncbi:hypothetical protein D9613_012590 [Agrocybe pediades]|uniref:RRM domain-containing protein n=1 Tax=Agrocybe pediades TaxID=84607 RepID=A0A8H4R1T0_9AGAR|nr:hypothetical protein D9613_012590 [Agrocybe pediades]
MSENLGKRKERDGEEEAKTHGATLFVSNLPYNATSVDLQTLFSDIAPVRSAFVVTEQGTGLSKGVGYVSFALKEDAEAAFADISRDGISLVGRKLRVQWADSKPREKGEKGEKKEVVKKEPKPRPAHQLPRVPHDPNATRTIVISGLPTNKKLDSKVLWKKIRKYEGAESVVWPYKNEEGEEDPTTAHVVFSNSTQACEAVNKLHAHVYKEALLSVTLKKRLETLSKPVTKPTKDSADVKGKAAAVVAPSHASRLIVRNIPFNATEQDLRAVFLPYGPIYSIHIPLDDRAAPEKSQDVKAESSTSAAVAAAYSSAVKPRTKGFAFVWMLSKKDAERAIEGCNGMVMRAGTAQKLVSDKQKKKKLKRLETKAAAARMKKEEGEEGSEDEEDNDEEKEGEVDDKRATERTIAVDWALSKDKWKEEKAKIMEDVDMEDASGSSDEEQDEGLGVHSGGEDDSDDSSDSQPDSDEDDSDNDEEPVKPELPPPEAGTTLFIRNIPFEATEEELRTLFKSFGPLRYARITMDPATGRPRGTGFACFWKLEDAQKAVQQSALLRSETTGQVVAPKKNPFAMTSLLTPDPSASLAQSLVLHGRTLDVVTAVTRDEAIKLKETNEKAREKADKRNMYLLREGVIMPGTPASELLTPAEVERRTSSFNARRALLKSNPSLFISKTRLSVRQIPLFVTERMLKRLVTHSIKAFNTEVKNKTRTPLTPDEYTETPAPNTMEKKEVATSKADETAEGKKKKGKFTGRDTGVKQTKIVRQAERVDPITGKGRSKGYGFVEMHRHSDALRFLRWANNNPEVGTLFQSWWKDELENILKAERAKEESEGDDARIKRLKEEIERAEEGGQKKSKGTLIVEFSIENIQVLQRRSAMQSEQKDPSTKTSSGNDKRRKRDAEDDEEGSKAEKHSPKKRRVEAKSQKAPEPTDSSPKKTPTKATNPLGSIIGRKRKERKAGKKGGK